MKFVYVLAIVEATCDPEGLGRHRGPDAIRFEHAVVEAVDEESAYVAGGAVADDQGWLPVKEGEVANDYVVPVEPDEFRTVIVNPDSEPE